VLGCLRGTWYVKGVHIPETFIDELRRALVVGHLSARDSIKGSLTGELIYWETHKMRFLRHMQNVL
jgi:hypothetical protein